jgi:hypothetical protein
MEIYISLGSILGALLIGAISSGPSFSWLHARLLLFHVLMVCIWRLG